MTVVAKLPSTDDQKLLSNQALHLYHSLFSFYIFYILFMDKEIRKEGGLKPIKILRKKYLLKM
jgi:hypothetical protein